MAETDHDIDDEIRDISDVPAVELINTVAVHLMSAAAVKLGLGDTPDAAADLDLDEARKLITSLAGLVTAAAPEITAPHTPNAAARYFPRKTAFTVDSVEGMISAAPTGVITEILCASLSSSTG